jgi:shikimate kinase
MNKLYLVGLPASGKTTTAKWLADKLGWTFVDLDELIERQDANESKNDVEIVSALEVIAECESEDQQKLAYDLLTEKGFKCRLVTL